jgi:hypothetical protein
MANRILAVLRFPAFAVLLVPAFTAPIGGVQFSPMQSQR